MTAGGSVWAWLDRALLVTVVGMQAAILYRGPAGPEAAAITDVVLDSDATASSVQSGRISARLRMSPGYVAEQQIKGPAEMRDSVLGAIRVAAAEGVQGRTRADVFHQMDRLFERALSDLETMTKSVDFHRGWDRLLPSPALDMTENAQNYIVLASIPGLSTNDVRLTLDGRILTLHTLLRTPWVPEPSRCRTRVELPGPVARASDIRAVFTNGYLKIVIPKAFMP